MNYDLIVQNIVKHKAIKLTTKKVEDSTMAKKGKKTELHFASEQGNLARVKALLAHCDEAEINERDQCAFAPLHYAAKEGHLAVVKALLAAGADVQLKELYNDREALPWAIEREHVEVMKVLLAHGADPNRPDGDGVSPLCLALREKYTKSGKEMVEALFAHGAIFDEKDEMLVFSLQYASPDIAKIFREHKNKKTKGQTKEAKTVGHATQRKFVFANPELGQQLQAQLGSWLDSGSVKKIK